MKCIADLPQRTIKVFLRTAGLGSEKRVPRRMWRLRTPNCSRPPSLTTTSTLSSAALPHCGQNMRPATCSHRTGLLSFSDA